MTAVHILIPLCDDWESARQLLAELDRVARARSERFAVTLVDDGSSQPCPFETSVLAGFSGLGPVELLELTGNQGHARAIAVGLSALAATREGRAVVVMDGDGEDRPEDVARLLERANGAADHVVAAERRRRSEPFGFRLAYLAYKLLFRLLTGRRLSFGNFCLLPWAVLVRLVHRPELWSHLAGTLLASPFPLLRLPTNRGRRYAGRSKMNLPALVQHGLGAIAVDLDRVLARLLVFLGILVVGVGSFALIVLAPRVIGQTPVPDWWEMAFSFAALFLLQSVVFALLLLFLSLRTRSLRPIIPALSWQDYVLTRRRLDAPVD